MMPLLLPEYCAVRMRIRRSRIQNGVVRGEGRHIKLRRRHALPDRRGEWLTKRYLSIVS